MNRMGIVVLGTLVGMVVGIVIGYLLSTERSPKPLLHESQHYYYRMSDSTMVRHTISVSDSGLNHTIDTLAVEQR